MELAQLLRPAARTAADFSSDTDDELVTAIAHGSHEAFEALYERHCQGMLSLARHLLGSVPEAEDPTMVIPGLPVLLISVVTLPMNLHVPL